MNTYQYLGWALLWTDVVYGTWNLIWYHQRKSLYPLSARLPIHMILHQVTFWFGLLTPAGFLIANMEQSCLLYHWMYLTNDAFVALPFMSRLIQLFFRNKITKEIAENRNLMESPKELPTIGWYTAHQRFATPKFLLLGICLCSFSIIPLCGFFNLAYPSVTYHLMASDPTCPLVFSYFENKYFFWIIVIAASSGGFFVIFQVKDIDEGLWIKKECAYCLFPPVIMLIICMIPQVNTKYVETISRATVYMCFQVLTFTIPTILTYLYPHRNKKRHRTHRHKSISQATQTQTSLDASIPRLHSYLEQPEQFQAFWNFLAKEFAVESLMFWKDIATIKNYISNQNNTEQQQLPGHVVTVNLTNDGSYIPSSNIAVFQMVQLVVKMYIVEGAPQSINISFIDRSEVLHRATKLSSQSIITVEVIDSLFKTALKDVLSMLEYDSFIRYVKSEHYLIPGPNSMHTEMDFPSEHSPREHSLRGEPPSPRDVSPIAEPSPSERSLLFPSINSVSGQMDEKELEEPKRSERLISREVRDVLTGLTTSPFLETEMSPLT